MKYILILILLFIIIIYTIIDRFLYLSNCSTNNTNNTNITNNKTNNKTDNKTNDILIKYSSINYKLNTNEEYEIFYNYINSIRDSIYINIINSTFYDENHINEMIINDIQKTKLKYNFNKLKNIFIIKKINDNNIKLIIFYDGLIYNNKKIKFIENNFIGSTIIYKVDLNNKLISHYLQ